MILSGENREKRTAGEWPADLAGHIDYQDGSVVSKTLLNRKAGTITLFAFDRDQGLSEHTAPFDAFVQVLEGEAGISIAGENYTVKEGCALIMPAGKPHSVRAIERFKMMLVMIRGNE